MYIPQPLEYYDDIADIACQVLEIPVCESGAILNKKSIREKAKKSKKYRIHKLVQYKTIYINKHQDNISIAKSFFFYFLWYKQVKSPKPDKSKHSFIFAAKEIIESSEEMMYLYELFYSLAEKIELNSFTKKVVIEFACKN